MKMDTIWDDSLGHRLKVERNLNFSTISNEEDEFGFSRKKAARDPMSHRIIEKRRRDRMNNCLADLSRLVPTNYLKKGRGRIEKTEIIEMAIKHLKHLQAHPCKDPATCEVAKTTEQDHKRQFRLGFHECLSETVRFMVEIEGLYSGDGICVRLVNHLQKHYDKVAGGLCYSQALGNVPPEEKSLHMEVENGHTDGQPRSKILDSFPETSSVHSESMGHPVDRIPLPLQPDVLKQEHDSTNGTYPHESLDYGQPQAPAKASQLREMLQNPGPLKDTHLVSKSTSVISAPPSSKADVYKFKNNIKHRFNADLRHSSSSPSAEEVNGNGHHNHETETELTKSGLVHHWETGSSCGSNPSTPPVARSNGSASSSGYSTNGDAKFKDHQHHLYTRSPSPVSDTNSIGVPIFALHPKGSFYIPLTIEAGLLAPYLLGLDELAPVLHPVSICVNFSLCHALKLNGKAFHFRPQATYYSSASADKLNGENYVYAERPAFLRE